MEILFFHKKKLKEVGNPEDEKDAANKKYVDDQFTPVMMTRNVFFQKE